MTNGKKNIKKFSIFYLLLLTILLSIIVIIFLNKNIKEKKAEQFKKEQYQKFEQIISRRELSFNDSIEKVCIKGSKNLQEYYKINNPSLIGVDNYSFHSENDEQPKYITNLMSLVTGESIEFSELAQSYIKHALVSIIFFAIGILSILGWIFCAACCCCNCCCCCCCKDKSCKTPCFIFFIIFSCVTIITSIIGLGKSNLIFTGLADTECSILQFIDILLNGQKSEKLPRWLGFQGINDFIFDIEKQINSTGKNGVQKMKEMNQNLQEKKNKFNNVFNEDYNTFFTTKDFLFDKYLLDQCYEYGPANPNEVLIGNRKFLDTFKEEYTQVTGTAEEYLNSTSQYLDYVFDISGIGYLFTDIREILDNLKGDIDSINENLSETVIDFSDLIDNYGKLYFKILFSVIIGLNSALVLFIFLFFCCGGDSTDGCCFCNCFLKFLIHLVWNILAILLIGSFIAGSIFTFIGTVGGDLLLTVSIFFSQENLNSENPKLVKEAGKYLDECINKEGNLIGSLDIVNDAFIEALEKVKSISSLMEDAKLKFNGIQKISIPKYRENLEKEKDFKNAKFISIYNISDFYSAQRCNYEAVPCPAIANNQITIMEKNLDKLDAQYQEILNLYLDTLITFDDYHKDLINTLNKYVGVGNPSFSFLNCQFIGVNLKIILKNLSEALGNNFYTIGKIIIVESCFMISVIISAILEVIIINLASEKEKNTKSFGKNKGKNKNANENINEPQSFRQFIEK